jgi:hypothetical protein
MTAAAGAQGAVMNPPLLLTSGARIPSTAAPTIPATAPLPASCGETAVKITTPNAMDEGSATSIAARAPHASAREIGMRPIIDEDSSVAIVMAATEQGVVPPGVVADAEWRVSSNAVLHKPLLLRHLQRDQPGR